MTLQELKTKVLEDGIVDADEVEELKKVIMADEIVDQDEANVLFEINDATTGKDNDPTWDQFFVDAITNCVLKDEHTPGVVDEAEADWLIGKVKGDGQVDELEKKLLANIKTNATSCHTKLTALFTELGI